MDKNLRAERDGYPFEILALANSSFSPSLPLCHTAPAGGDEMYNVRNPVEDNPVSASAAVYAFRTQIGRSAAV